MGTQMPSLSPFLFFLFHLLLLSHPSFSSSSPPSFSKSSLEPTTVAVQLSGYGDLPFDALESVARELGKAHGLELVGPVGKLRGFFLFQIPPEFDESLEDIFSEALNTKLNFDKEKEDAEEAMYESEGRGEGEGEGEREREGGQEEANAPPKTRKTLHHGPAQRKLNKLVEEPHVEWAQLQKPLVRKKRKGFLEEEEEEPPQGEYEPLERSSSRSVFERFERFEDPLFPSQWHLFDPIYGNDINVTGVWEQGIYGEGVVVSLIDDGLDFTHPDIADNFFAPGSYDFNFNKPEPIPSFKDDVHGTRCAGEIAAIPNDSCGVGVAFKAKVAGERILSGDVTDAMEASALNFAWDKNHIYSNSWGPWDNGATVEGPGVLCQRALEEGVSQGRGGLGSIFVFASGNGGPKDNCNYDGYTNSIYTISIGSIDRNNMVPNYQEMCAAQMAVTYSSNSKDYILTTDVEGQCSNRHGGTSAAAPLAAGIFALVLSVRPDLTWRDLQWLIVESAQMVNPDDPDWSTNRAGYHFNHQFGFGKLDAYQIVEMAKIWNHVGPHSSITMATKTPSDGTIPHGTVPLSSSVTVHPKDCGEGFFRIEHVTVTVDIRHERRGDLAVQLVSPSGEIAILATERSKDTSREGLKGWTFMTVKFWGEEPSGTWTLQVFDRINPSHRGALLKWTLALHGERRTEPDPNLSKRVHNELFEDDLPSMVRQSRDAQSQGWLLREQQQQQQQPGVKRDRVLVRGVFGGLACLFVWLMAFVVARGSLVARRGGRRLQAAEMEVPLLLPHLKQKEVVAVEPRGISLMSPDDC